MTHPLGMTLGSMNPETEEEFFVCQHCADFHHDKCTGLAVDPDDNGAYACECRAVHPVDLTTWFVVKAGDTVELTHNGKRCGTVTIMEEGHVSFLKRR